MAKTTLNGEGESSARVLIRAGHYDMSSAWSFDAADGDRLLGPQGDDWAKYGRWHLGEDPAEPDDTKAHWKFPYGKDGKVYRRAVAAIRSRASQNGDDAIFEAAGRLMTAMDEEEGKKEGRMAGLRGILGSRFGHFAGGPAAAAPEPEDEEDEAKRAARKAAEDEEARRKAEEAEKKRSRRTRRARKGKKGDNGDDADDASDDDEDDDDEEEMKKAAAAGHGFALEAAFRSGARAQRERCSRIFAAASAGVNPELAAKLAFETRMPADEAIGVLEAAPVPAPSGRASLADRMAASGAGDLRIPNAAPHAPTGQAAIAASWDAATKPFAIAAR